MPLLGIIGLGTMGKIHLSSYLNIPGVRVVVYDADQRLTRETAITHGVEPARSLDELLSREDLAGVAVCVPTFLHREVVLEAARHRKHVFCEKPLARSEEDARTMIDALDGAGVTLSVGHVVRLFPEYVKARDLVRSGVIGTPCMLRASRTGPFPRSWANWYADWGKSGGVLLDLMIHDLDFISWTFGEVSHIWAASIRCSQQPTQDMEDVDFGVAGMRLENGMICHCEASWAHPEPFCYKMEIVGDAGVINIDSSTQNGMQLLLRTSPERHGAAVPRVLSEHDPYYQEARWFVKVLRGEEKPLVDGLDALRSLRLSLAAILSATRHSPLSLRRGSM